MLYSDSTFSKYAQIFSETESMIKAGQFGLGAYGLLARPLQALQKGFSGLASRAKGLFTRSTPKVAPNPQNVLSQYRNKVHAFRGQAQQQATRANKWRAGAIGAGALGLGGTAGGFAMGSQGKQDAYHKGMGSGYAAGMSGIDPYSMMGAG